MKSKCQLITKHLSKLQAIRTKITYLIANKDSNFSLTEIMNEYQDALIKTDIINRSYLAKQKGCLTISSFNQFGLARMHDNCGDEIIDRKGKPIFSVDTIEDLNMNEGFFVCVQTEGFEAYTIRDPSGKMVVEDKFYWVESISSHVAMVRYDKEAKYFSFLNLDSKKYFDFTEFKAKGYEPSKDNFHDDVIWLTNRRSHNILVDKEMNIIAETNGSVGNFSEGLCSVINDGESYFINKKGEKVIEVKFISAGEFKNGYNVITQKNRDGYISYFIDKTGRIFPQQGFQDTPTGYTYFEYGLMPIKILSSVCACWRYINKKCEEVKLDYKAKVKDDFKAALPFTEGVAWVETDDSNGYYLIDATGRRILEKTYGHPVPFENGVAAVDNIYIDKDGNTIFEPIYDEY